MRALQATPAGSVGTAQLIDGQITAPKLAASAVGATQLAPGAVTASKLATDAVGGASIADGSLQTIDVGSFTGAIQVDFSAFAAGTCQVADVAAQPAGGGQPNIADDVVAISPAAGWPDQLVVNAKPSPANHIRLVACYVAPQGAEPIDPPSTIFRYVTFDSP